MKTFKEVIDECMSPLDMELLGFGSREYYPDNSGSSFRTTPNNYIEDDSISRFELDGYHYVPNEPILVKEQQRPIHLDVDDILKSYSFYKNRTSMNHLSKLYKIIESGLFPDDIEIYDRLVDDNGKIFIKYIKVGEKTIKTKKINDFIKIIS